jgi:uncharacterized membrane protein/invasion protein IalB
MPARTRVLLACLLALILAPCAHAQTRKSFGAWSVECSGGATGYCSASNRIKSVSGPYRFQLNVSRERAGADFEVALLTGYQHPADGSAIVIQVDGDKPIKLTPKDGYRRAGRSNTYVIAASEAERLLKQMRGGKRARFRFEDAKGAAVDTGFALGGLGAAFGFMDQMQPAPPRRASGTAVPPATKPAAATEAAKPLREPEAALTTQTAPAPKEVAPTTTQAAPPPKQVAPTTVQPALPPNQVAPTTTQPAPTQKQVASTTAQPAPPPKEVAPTTTQPALPPKEVAPTTTQPAPTQRQTAPTTAQPAPLPKEVAPTATPAQVATQATPAPVAQPAPVAKEAIPAPAASPAPLPNQVTPAPAPPATPPPAVSTAPATPRTAPPAVSTAPAPTAARAPAQTKPKPDPAQPAEAALAPAQPPPSESARKPPQAQNQVAVTAPPSASRKRGAKSIRQFSCRGNEPFWTFVIDGDRARYGSMTQSGQLDSVELTGRLNVTGDGPTPIIDWRGKSDWGGAFRAVVAEGHCRDSMSDSEGQTEFEYLAQITTPGAKKSARGCCNAGLPPVQAAAPTDTTQFPVADLRNRPETDWSRYLFDFLPAIQACIDKTPEPDPYATKAWPMNRGMVGVRTRNAQGGWFECVADSNGKSIERFVPLPPDAPPAPNENRVVFSPPDHAPPGGNCFKHERVMDGMGDFMGWLSTNACS